MSALTFHDGKLTSELPEGIEISPSKSFSDKRKAEQGITHAGEETHLYVPPGKKVDLTLHFDAGNPYILLFVGKGAEVRWTCRFVGEVTPYLDIALEEGARFKLYSMSEGTETIRATVKRDARFESFIFTTGSDQSDSNYHLSLLGENSDAKPPEVTPQ